jgi:hypothetical protein
VRAGHFRLEIELRRRRLERGLERCTHAHRQSSREVEIDAGALSVADDAAGEQPAPVFRLAVERSVREVLLVACGRQTKHDCADTRHLDRQSPRRHFEVERERVERKRHIAGLAARRAGHAGLNLRPERDAAQLDELAVALRDEQIAHGLARTAGVLARLDEAACEHLVAQPGGVRVRLMPFDVLLLPPGERSQLQPIGRLDGRGVSRCGLGSQRVLDSLLHDAPG